MDCHGTHHSPPNRIVADKVAFSCGDLPRARSVLTDGPDPSRSSISRRVDVDFVVARS